MEDTFSKEIDQPIASPDKDALLSCQKKSSDYIRCIQEKLESIEVGSFFPDAVFSHPVCFLSFLEKCPSLQGRIGSLASRLILLISTALGKIFGLYECPPGTIIDYARILRESIDSELPSEGEGDREFPLMFAKELDNCMWCVISEAFDMLDTNTDKEKKGEVK